MECERVGVGEHGGEGLQGWGTAEWLQTSPNWHLTFFLPLALEWASFQALSGSLLEKCLMQIQRMDAIVKRLILTAHTTMKLRALLWTCRCVRERSRQWPPKQLQSEQTLYGMFCQVILTFSKCRGSVQSLSIMETNVCFMHHFLCLHCCSIV